MESRRSTWTAAEDRAIAVAVQQGVRKWSEVAERVATGRTGKQCKERWVNHLDPSLTKLPWTDDEDRDLIAAQHRLGNSWKAIAMEMPGRSENEVKNRWHSAVVRGKRSLTEGSLASPTKSRRLEQICSPPAEALQLSADDALSVQVAEMYLPVLLPGYIAPNERVLGSLQGRSEIQAWSPRRNKGRAAPAVLPVGHGNDKIYATSNGGTADAAYRWVQSETTSDYGNVAVTGNAPIASAEITLPPITDLTGRLLMHSNTSSGSTTPSSSLLWGALSACASPSWLDSNAGSSATTATGAISATSADNTPPTATDQSIAFPAVASTPIDNSSTTIDYNESLHVDEIEGSDST